MTNIIDLESTRKMGAPEIIKSLIEAGFTKQQAMGLNSVISGIRSGMISVDDAETFLEHVGFEDAMAEELSKVLFQALAAA